MYLNKQYCPHIYSGIVMYLKCACNFLSCDIQCLPELFCFCGLQHDFVYLDVAIGDESVGRLLIEVRIHRQLYSCGCSSSFILWNVKKKNC